MALTATEEAAYAQVKATQDKVSADYNKCLKDIEIATKVLQDLPLKTIPFADMKVALSEMVDKKSAEHDAYMKDVLINIATGSFNTRKNLRIGEPILFDTVEGSTNAAESGDFAQVNDLVVDFSGVLVTQAFCCVTNSLLKAKIASLLATLSPADLGYSLIPASEIGTDRATRRAAIATAKANLTALKSLKVSLEGDFLKLGISKFSKA